jgi:predicted membrane channel-forming protein YqfA (hemolysin III family)
MSSKAFTYFRRLDYAGIILNVVGTGIAPIYYSLYCNLGVATVYLTVMIVFGTGLFVALLGNWIHREENKHWKPVMFGAFGLTYVIPYAHFMLA